MTQFVFAADNGTNGRELWATDGTPAGTQLLVDIWPGGGSSSPRINFGFGPSGFLGDGRVLFAATDPVYGIEPWVTDGTAAGTQLVADINQTESGFGGSGPNSFTALGNGRAVFSANDGVTGFEPWITDGRSGGTHLLVDINPGLNSSFTALGDGRALFSANESVTGIEPWITDGTPGGTLLLADINPGLNGSAPSGFAALGDGRALFSATDPTHGNELWVTDGTPDGTQLVANINPTMDGFGSSAPGRIVATGDGQAIFAADDGSHGRELWVTDGSAAGTQLLADINPGVLSSSPNGFMPTAPAVQPEVVENTAPAAQVPASSEAMDQWFV